MKGSDENSDNSYCESLIHVDFVSEFVHSCVAPRFPLNGIKKYLTRSTEYKNIQASLLNVCRSHKNDSLMMLMKPESL